MCACPNARHPAEGAANENTGETADTRAEDPTGPPPQPGRRRRDDRIDSLRGLLLAIMLIDHLGGPLQALTWEPLGFVSAAEGFVFLSGYMFALVYVGNARSSRELLDRSLQRAWLIYRYHVGCLAVLLAAAWLVPTLAYYWQLQPLIDHPFTRGLLPFALINTPEYFDILPMYVVFVLITPAAVHALRHGYGAVVVATSVGLWIIGQLGDPMAPFTGLFVTEPEPAFFNLLAWQLLWMLGLGLGYYRDAVQRAVQRLPAWVLAAPLVAVGLLFLARHGLLPMHEAARALARDDLGWMRLLNFAGLALIFAWLLSRIPVATRLPWFAYIGRSSIQVFSFHLLLAYLALAVGWHLRAIGGEALFAIFTVACLASLTLPAAWAHRRPRIGPLLKQRLA